eukprot:TRINITY_DN67708_c5_g10_i1.p1 TRINITY_DN67708_c5_g10~~TRINITY_DN67708_c5_g10_i1.p1  ORF type:complete len:655 (-),score=71.53 TRINITY_DN67708_c5_g10_i1:280-2076(-)
MVKAPEAHALTFEERIWATRNGNTDDSSVKPVHRKNFGFNKNTPSHKLKGSDEDRPKPARSARLQSSERKNILEFTPESPKPIEHTKTKIVAGKSKQYKPHSSFGTNHQESSTGMLHFDPNAPTQSTKPTKRFQTRGQTARGQTTNTITADPEIVETYDDQPSTTINLPPQGTTASPRKARPPLSAASGRQGTKSIRRSNSHTPTTSNSRYTAPRAPRQPTPEVADCDEINNRVKPTPFASQRDDESRHVEPLDTTQDLAAPFSSPPQTSKYTAPSEIEYYELPSPQPTRRRHIPPRSSSQTSLAHVLGHCYVAEQDAHVEYDPQHARKRVNYANKNKDSDPIAQVKRTSENPLAGYFKGGRRMSAPSTGSSSSQRSVSVERRGGLRTQPNRNLERTDPISHVAPETDQPSAGRRGRPTTRAVTSNPFMAAANQTSNIQPQPTSGQKHSPPRAKRSVALERTPPTTPRRNRSITPNRAGTTTRRPSSPTNLTLETAPAQSAEREEPVAGTRTRGAQNRSASLGSIRTGRGRIVQERHPLGEPLGAPPAPPTPSQRSNASARYRSRSNPITHTAWLSPTRGDGPSKQYTRSPSFSNLGW